MTSNFVTLMDALMITYRKYRTHLIQKAYEFFKFTFFLADVLCHIGNVGSGRQNGDHKAKAIKKDPATGVEPAANAIPVHCFTFELIWVVLRIPNFSFIPAICLHYSMM